MTDARATDGRRDPGIPIHATVRVEEREDGDNLLGIECRFADGQKFTAAYTDIDCELFAHFIAAAPGLLRRAVELLQLAQPYVRSVRDPHAVSAIDAFLDEVLP